MNTAVSRSVASVVGAVVFACVASSTVFAQARAKPDQQMQARAIAPAYVAPYLEPERPKSTPVFDARFLGMSVLAMGLTIADIERTQHCLGNGTCREMNPLLPQSRAGMYAVNLPVNAAVMYLSYRLKASGHRTWWIAPVVISGAHGVGLGFRF